MIRSSIKFNLKHLYRKSELMFIGFFLIVLIVISGILEGSFLTLGNFINLIITSVPLIMVTYAQTVIILGGGLDLSVGAMICLANVLCATTMKDTPFGFIIGIILSLVVGAVFGFANGMIITKGKQQPIIITLAMSSIVGGLALAILPKPGGLVHKGFGRFLTGDILGIPVPLILVIVVSVVMWFLVSKTSFGRAIYAIGGNTSAAYSTGIQVDRVKIISYMLSGVLSAMAGIYISAQIYSGDPTIGLTYTLKSVTTVVVGGTALAGGKGGIIGGLIGSFILLIINNMLNLINISTFYQFIFQGGILIIALAISSVRSGK